MKKAVSKLPWGVSKRLEFIELQLLWEGEISRGVIQEKFDISTPQASNDLKVYQEAAPHNIQYDTRRKRYLASDRFEPVFIKPDPSQYLLQLRQLADNAITQQQSWLTFIPDYCTMPVPVRSISPHILGRIVRAIKDKKSLRLQYQSLSEKNSGPKWRWITPHAFAADGQRWHVRAYCHIDNKFKDFILSRFLNVGEFGEPLAASVDDKYWHIHFKVELKPNPKLTESQRRIIAHDYCMKKERVTITLRQCLLYYFKTRLCLDQKPTDNPYAMPVVIANKTAFDKALKEAS